MQFRSIVWSNQDVLATWLCKRIGLVPTANLKCLGRVDKDGQIMGVIGYDGYNRASVQMHSAGVGNWVSREFIYAAFDYPFRVMGCEVVLGLVSEKNEDALRLNRHAGFVEVARVPDAHPDGALVLMQMRRENCRWLRNRKILGAVGLELKEA